MAAATGTGGEERECILGGFMEFRFSPTQKKKKKLYIFVPCGRDYCIIMQPPIFGCHVPLIISLL